MNKVWQKPKLIILYRGRPEESVLAVCKAGTSPDKAQSVSNKQNDCYKNPGCLTCSFVFWT